MPFPTLARAVLGAMFICCLHLTPAQAQPFQYVATTGSDAGMCGAIVTPCRTFQRLHDLVGAGFTIVALDSGDFNAITITKSIAIVARGVAATGWSGANTKITINAGANDVIHIDGLRLGRNVPQGDNSGIQFNSGGRLLVRNCVIRGLGTAGIYVRGGGAKRVFISDCTIANNFHGVFVRPGGAGSSRVQLDNVRIEGNSSSGIRAVGSGAIVRISNSTITNNGRGLAALNNGKIVSFGNNVIIDNNVNGAPTSTIALK
jgi:hypothetical protein